ncbi:MAG: site-specific integrase [Rhodococcus sp. (in: high G+C Gram-positive bacteria)]|uniref:tyrosine-type recombinase/integrase n=1 Tax=Rhodococcus sp. TaxID=1831 RepID=UPI002AD84175|nr:site-specific integrase [Rhodococcus sp. (in: high G+C Gram-positive bacteria)]
MARNQLPPQIRKITVRDRKSHKPLIRYQVTVDTGTRTAVEMDADGVPRTVSKRTQTRRRYKTEQEARTALAATLNSVNDGLYVHTSELNVEMAIEYWLTSKHSLKPSSLHGHRTNLRPVVSELGQIPIQKLTKPHIESLVKALRAGGLPTPQGRPRKPWSARTVNYMLGLLASVLQDQMRQGNIVRNVAAMVDRLPSEAREMDTLSKTEAAKLLAHVGREPMPQAWQLAMHGLRRGEIAGLRWSDVDLAKSKLKIANTRIAVGSTIIEGPPKTKKSRRTLPLTKPLAAALKAAKAQQAQEKLALGEHYQDSDYVVRLPTGLPVHPNLLTFRWKKILESAGLKHVRLHDARHTCATLMHLQGIPIAVIAAWLGHASAAFTLSVYAHSQEEALMEAASSFE